MQVQCNNRLWSDRRELPNWRAEEKEGTGQFVPSVETAEDSGGTAESHTEAVAGTVAEDTAGEEDTAAEEGIAESTAGRVEAYRSVVYV